ncbi:MAG: hypothetical protein ABSB42_17635 [Tepidisphaeraceae bacterium]
MTVVIAEISKSGIVMAADTAETSTVKAKSGKEYTRIRHGAQKLFPVPDLKGGVSYWGAGEIFEDGASGRIPTDVWLEDFIAREKLNSLEEFAHTLRRWINVLHGLEGPLLGFQIAGIGRTNSGDNQPVFHRICNHDKKGGRKPEFEIELRKGRSNHDGVTSFRVQVWEAAPSTKPL